jgi:hypothetical protein
MVADSNFAEKINKHLKAGVYNLDVTALVSYYGTTSSNSAVSTVKISSYDWQGSVIEEKLITSNAVGTIDVDDPFPKFSYTVSECFTNSTFPIASFKVWVQTPSGVNVTGAPQHITARMIYPSSSEALSRSVLLFEGIGDTSTLTLSAGALLHVTPQPVRYANLLGRPMLHGLVYASVVNDFMAALIQHMPNAFSDTTKNAFVAQLKQYEHEGSLEMAFSLKSFASFAKGVERFGKDALAARHFISDVAKVVKPMLAGASSVPGIGRYASMAAEGITDAQDIGILEARTIYP